MAQPFTEYTFKRFDSREDIIAGKQKTRTFPMWSDSPSDSDENPESILTAFYTSSTEKIAWEGYYYYNVYSENSDTNLNAPVQFSIAFATTSSVLLQHADTEYQYTYPSRAVYGQWLNILEERSIGNNETPFQRPSTSGSTTQASMNVLYIISVARARIKDRVELNTWQLNLSGSGGAGGTLLTLINTTGSAVGTKVVDIIAGDLADYTGPSTTVPYGTPIGQFYPERGVFVLDAERVHYYIGSGSIESYNPTTVAAAANYAPSASLKNIFQLVNRGMYFRARTTEAVQSTHYFCRIKNYEFNYSTNPTWVSGSDNEILDDFYAEPKTFITTIGLYDGDSDSGQLVAVAKLSRPIPKDAESEVLVKVKLDF